MRATGTYNDLTAAGCLSGLPVFSGHKNPAFADEVTFVTGDVYHGYSSSGAGAVFVAYARKEAAQENGWSFGVYFNFNGVGRDMPVPGAYTLAQAIKKIKEEQAPHVGGWNNVLGADTNAFHYEHVVLPSPDQPDMPPRVKQYALPEIR